MPIKPKDNFGRWIVLREAQAKNRKDNPNKKIRYWLCECKCGTQRAVEQSSLVSKASKSCGCLQRENASKSSTTHKLCKTAEYRLWQNIKDRCSNEKNPNFQYYGGRGIFVCDKWKNSFESFYHDIVSEIGKKPSKNVSLDRKNNDKGYRPKNVRWADTTQQANNKRNNHRLTFKNETLSLRQWGRKLGIDARTLHTRLKLGWSVKDTLTKPLKKNKSLSCLSQFFIP